jgi:potassium channel subfamily K, other eukaryote
MAYTFPLSPRTSPTENLSPPFFMTQYFNASFTIGLGDLTPTHTASRVLLFPFAVFTIAGLANQVAIITDFLASRGRERRAAWQINYEEHIRATADKRDTQSKDLTKLAREVRLLQQFWRGRQVANMVYNLILSLAGFIVFWIIGAAIFHGTEGWSYGISICESFGLLFIFIY